MINEQHHIVRNIRDEEQLKKDDDSRNEFNSEDYSELFELMFSDLIRLSKGDKEIFLDLYYNRDDDVIEFKMAAKNLYETGSNLIIIGDAGIGKSSFIYRLYYDKALLEELKLFPIIFDYRDSQEEKKQFFFKQTFIEDIKKYLDSIGRKVTLSDDQDSNLHLIQKEILDKDNLHRKEKHLIIFVDDLDYAEQKELFPILKFLTPYARSPNISIALSVRPTLFKTIQRNDGTFRYYFTQQVKKIELHDLSIHHILAMRLAPILATSNIENKGFLGNVIHKLLHLKSSEKNYVKILKRLGITNLESLKNFHFPFTEEYCSFMKNVSSNNIRECFNIAIESLMYILEHYGKLIDNTDKETGEVRKEITNKIIVDLFTKEGSKYTLFDLHEIKNDKNNSLYFNTLEAVKYCNKGNLNANFYLYLEKLGHERNDVDNTLRLLGRRSNRFLSSNDFTYAQDYTKEPIKYEITKKGEYYLSDISKWSEYKDKFDSTNATKSVKDLIEGTL